MNVQWGPLVHVATRDSLSGPIGARVHVVRKVGLRQAFEGRKEDDAIATEGLVEPINGMKIQDADAEFVGKDNAILHCRLRVFRHHLRQRHGGEFFEFLVHDAEPVVMVAVFCVVAVVEIA